jgi:FeS assembly SUF system regulator
MIILSKLADYGIIIATHLAVDPERQINAAVMAKETQLPQATVAKLLKKLAHAGVVLAVRGVAGGYRLARPPADISVADVVVAVDGAIGVTECGTHEADCSRLDFCLTRPHLQRISRTVAQALAGVTLEEIARPFFLPPVSPASRKSLETRVS